MRPIVILASFCLACGIPKDDQAAVDSAKAADSIKLRLARKRAAAVAADNAERDSAVRLAQQRIDSQRVSLGIPSDAELSAMVRRLPPDSLGFMPVKVQSTLNQRGCLIPQPFETEFRNAATGAFTAKGTVEWAVLCSVGGDSQILIIASQTGAVVDSLDGGSDAGGMQGIGGGKWGYSRLVNTLPKERIARQLIEEYGKAIPQPIDHDALDVAFLEKASEAYYRAGGNWYRVTTSD
jgi:hypothetical protein